MAELINGFTVTASNASKKGSQQASVTVRASSGDIAARIYSEHSQPLKWLRKWPHSAERLELVAQMKQYGMSMEDINALVSM